MTNEEAIKFLKQLYPNGGGTWLDEQRIEAISMAVNALEKCKEEESRLSTLERNGKNYKETASEDLETEIQRHLEECLDVKFPTTDIEIIKKDVAYTARRFANWQKEQMMKDAVEAVISQVPCSNEIIFYNPASINSFNLPQEMNRKGLEKGDKVRLIIIK